MRSRPLKVPHYLLTKRPEMQRICEHCKNPGAYDEKFDAFLCVNCDCWLEKNCLEETCEFCSSRPEKPSNRKNAKQ